MPAKDKLISARATLVLDEPFFGSLVLGLQLKEDTTCPTAWVDGVHLGYNPKFIESLNHSQLVALLAHEVMHCASGHPWRRDGREQKKWNVACDRAINGLLKDSGFTLPKDACMPAGDEIGKSAEYIFARIPDPQPSQENNSQQQQQPGPGGNSGGDDGNNSQQESGGDDNSKPDPMGEVRDAPTGNDENGDPVPTEADWQQATQQAALQAKAHGKLPGGMERFAAAAVKPRVDWKSALRRFVQTYSNSDYSWKQPNPRYIAGGMYLPSLYSEELGSIAIAVDTSGSMDEIALASAQAELSQIVSECIPNHVTVYYCDSHIHRTDEFEKMDPVTWNPCGGGGTDFRPVFDAVESGDVKPQCLIYITDLEGTFPQIEPEIPVLWVSDGRTRAPFGEVLAIED